MILFRDLVIAFIFIFLSFGFGLVSLFNGISTFVGYFNVKTIHIEEEELYNLNHSWGDKWVYTFPKVLYFCAAVS